MKHFALAFILTCTSLITVSLYAQETVTDSATGLSFPREITIENNGQTYHLEATGVATRKKFYFIKVYSIVSYLQKNAAGGGTVIDKILSDNNAKQLTIKYVRDVTVNEIHDAFHDAFHRVFPGQEYAQQQNTINQFLKYFNQPVKSGDEGVFRWFPQGVIEVLINGKKVGEFNNAAFAKGLWEIWFGPNSVVSRSDLVSMEK